MSARRVVVASRINHGSQIALALHDQGWLRVYLGPILFTRDHSGVAGRLAAVRAVVSSRLYPEMKGVPRRTLLCTELATRFATRMPLNFWWRHAVSAIALDVELFVRIPRATVIHLHSNCLHWAWKRARHFGAKVVCEHRALHPDEEHPQGSPLHSRLLQELAQADLVILPSERARSSFIQFGHDPEKLHVVRLGLDAFQDPRPHIPLADRSPRVLFVGAVAQRKSLETLFKAIAALAPLEPELRIVGASHDAELMQRLLTLYPQAIMLGPLNRESLYTEYENARLLVLPSQGESFGLVVGEAMKVGTPIAVSRGCGIAELIDPGVNGYLFDVGDDSTLSTQIEAALDPRLCATHEAMVSAARITSSKQSWERYRTELVAVYEGSVWPGTVARVT